jgi:hypothetical protein
VLRAVREGNCDAARHSATSSCAWAAARFS